MAEFVERLRTASEDHIAGYHFRQFEHMTVGKYTVSIQASDTHYCEPRKTVNPLLYTRWEVAAWGERGDPWVSPQTHPHLFADNYDARKGWEDGASAVGGYIPTDAVQRLLDAMEADHG